MQNERQNRTLLDMVNAMIISCSGVPQKLWGEALLSACYILNRIPVRDNAPYEFFKGYPPRLHYFRFWRCLAKVGIPEPKKKKGQKTVDAIVIHIDF